MHRAAPRLVEYVCLVGLRESVVGCLADDAAFLQSFQPQVLSHEPEESEVHSLLPLCVYPGGVVSMVRVRLGRNRGHAKECVRRFAGGKSHA